MFCSPFLNREDIAVEVEDGVVVLTGTVTTLREKEWATECALARGRGRCEKHGGSRYGIDPMGSSVLAFLPGDAGGSIANEWIAPPADWFDYSRRRCPRRRAWRCLHRTG